MDIPFYYSFKDFDENYSTILENWLNDYPDATERDFLAELKDLYEPFVKWKGSYLFNDGIRIQGVSKSNVYNGIYNMEYYKDLVIEAVTDEIDTLNSFIEDDIKIDYKNENYLDYWELINDPNSGIFSFDNKKHKYLKFFFNRSYLHLEFDEKKYKNFSFSVVKIAEWIDDEINNKRTNKEKIKESETITVQPISIIDIYKPGLSHFYKLVKKENNLNGNIYRNVESENEKILSDKSNTELNHHKTKFNNEFRYLISKLNDFFSNLDDYLEPKINTEKRNIKDYKDTRENNLNLLEVEIENRFTNLNNFLLQLGIYRSENNFIDAYKLRDYYKSMTGLYKKFIEDYGIEINKTPFKEKFENFISNIETSLNTDELKFINQLQNNTINKIQPDTIENNFTDYEKEIGKGKNIPYKLELLKQLGIMDILNSKYDNNKEQLYRILDFLTGGSSKNYYLSMYGDDYNGKDKVTPFHTAYLRKNDLI